MTTHVDWFRFTLFVACLAFVGATGLAQTQAGAIKAVRVSGEVTRVDSWLRLPVPRARARR